MAIGHGPLKGFGLLGGGPADGLVEADELIDWDIAAVAVLDGGRGHRCKESFPFGVRESKRA